MISFKVRTPTILQMEAAECGAASLAMVLTYYGRFITLEELRVMCGVSRDGSSAINVARAGRKLGLTVKPKRIELEGLSELTVPAILHWGMDHFLVLEHADATGAVVNDPASGRRRVDLAELDRSFTGIALTFEPNEQFERGGETAGGWSGLRERLRGHGAALWFLLMLSLPIIVGGLMSAAASQLFIDYVLIGGTTGWFRALMIGMGLLALMTALATYMQRLVMLRLETAVAVAGAFGYMRHVLRLPVAYFAHRRPADMPSRVALNDTLAQTLASDLGTAGLSLLASTAFLAVMLIYAPPLALIVLAFSMVSFGTMILLGRSLREDSQRQLIAQTRAAGMAREGLRIAEAYKASGTEDKFVSQLVSLNARQQNLGQFMAFRQAFLSVLPGLMGTLGAAAVLVVGGFRIMDGVMTIGALVAFQSLMTSFNAPMAQLTQIGVKLQSARAALTMLDDTLRHPEAPEFRQLAEQTDARVPYLAGAVELRGVTFGYSPVEAPLLNNISLSIAAGTRVAIVGGSGSGKSTLGMLLTGLYQPWAGEVLIDGKPLLAIPRQVLRRSVAVVDQRIVLFEGTIRDNIALWNPTLSDETIAECARDAAIHEAVVRRHEAYNSPVAEDGRNFSGGERARIEIARALTQSPSILVLDEATAALDMETEATVLRRLRHRGCTMIVIAHRLSAILECDHAVVLQKGCIVEAGRPRDLLAAGGAFTRLMGHA